MHVSISEGCNSDSAAVSELIKEVRLVITNYQCKNVRSRPCIYTHSLSYLCRLLMIEEH